MSNGYYNYAPDSVYSGADSKLSGKCKKCCAKYEAEEKVCDVEVKNKPDCERSLVYTVKCSCCCGRIYMGNAK